MNDGNEERSTLGESDAPTDAVWARGGAMSQRPLVAAADLDWTTGSEPSAKDSPSTTGTDVGAASRHRSHRRGVALTGVAALVGIATFAWFRGGADTADPPTNVVAPSRGSFPGEAGFSVESGLGESEPPTTSSSVSETVVPLPPPAAPDAATGAVRIVDGIDFGLSGSTMLSPTVFDAFGVVHEVDLANGSIRSTTATRVDSGAPAYIFADQGSITVVAYDDVPGFEFAADRTVTVISAADQPGGLLFAGPFANTAWEIDRGALPGTYAALVDLGNMPLGPIVERSDIDLLGSDGEGELVVSAVGGIYTTGIGETSRLTTGEVLAIGPNHVIARECDEQLVCSIVRNARRGGTTESIDDPSLQNAPNAFVRLGAGGGWLSPDGDVALVQNSPGALAWSLVDLSTGVRLDAPGPTAFSSVTWSDDSMVAAWLSGERLRLYDRAAGQIIEVDELVRLRALAPTNNDRPSLVTGSVYETGTAFADGAVFTDDDVISPSD